MQTLLANLICLMAAMERTKEQTLESEPREKGTRMEKKCGAESTAPRLVCFEENQRAS
jgi:hypothetical protein